MKITGLIALLAFLSIAVADDVQLKPIGLRSTRPINRCALKPKPGPCRGAFRRYFFNKKTKKCQLFIWGGCQGVVPFETKSDCQAKCENPCKLRPDAGLCEAAIESYFFNRKTKKCQKFFWGGCGGTRPFETLTACQRRCGKNPCKQRPDPGPCEAAIESYFFNRKTKKCQKFLWGGCGGTRPFKTQKACQKKCDKTLCDVTPQDAVPPPGTVTCQAFWTTWFYNARNKRCDKFSYSGCGPIGFRTERECLGVCKRYVS